MPRVQVPERILNLPEQIMATPMGQVSLSLSLSLSPTPTLTMGQACKGAPEP